MPLLMPCEPGMPRRVDPAWAREHAVLRDSGADIALVDHDALERGDGVEAIRRSGLAERAGRIAAWRGWMMSTASYALLCDLLSGAGLSPLDGPEAYSLCHHAPLSIDALSGLIAPTHLVSHSDREAIARTLLALQGRPLVIKDWVKSESFLWDEACFIPEPADLSAAMRVIDRFLELRGPALTGGLVLREFQPLEKGEDGRALEWRSFVVDGVPVQTFCRNGDAALEGPPAPLLRSTAERVPARFWTMDWARHRDGGWLLLEIGYGGVSGIPDEADPAPTLQAVARSCD